MKQPLHCALCGRKRGDGRRDRGWLYWVVDVHQRRGAVVIGPVAVRVATCPSCWRTEIKPEFDALATRCNYRHEHDLVADRPTGVQCTNTATHQIDWGDGRYSLACADHLSIEDTATVRPVAIEPLSEVRA